MPKETVVSAEGLKKLQDRLNELKTVSRKEVAEKIKIARGYGDLSENSEYDEAKNEQGLIETEIQQLEEKLKYVRVIDDAEANAGDKVSLGKKVTVRTPMGDDAEYVIVGSTESDPMNGRISDESAVGKALLGAAVGASVNVTVPSGKVVTYTVLAIGC